MSKVDLLNQVSIIVPTVSRPFAVRRHFDYWRGTGAQVLILDGASEPMTLTDEERSTSNVHYIHSGARFNDRLASAGRFIKTPYAALLCDDEFFLKDGLRECVKYLDENPEVIGCGGKVLGFFVDQKRFLAFPMYEDWRRFPLDANDVKARLDFALPPSKAHKVQFSLFRSEVWAEIFHASYKDFYSCGYVYERILNFYSAILGRTELLDCVLWMRSLENLPLSTENVPRYGKHEFDSWGTSPEFAEEVEHWRNRSRDLLSNVPSLSNDEVENFLYRFIDGGIQRQVAKVSKKRMQIGPKIGRLLIAAGPSSIKKFAKRYIPSRFLRVTGWQGMELDELLKGLDSDGIRACRKSLQEVQGLALRR